IDMVTLLCKYSNTVQVWTVRVNDFLFHAQLDSDSTITWTPTREGLGPSLKTHYFFICREQPSKIGSSYRDHQSRQGTISMLSLGMSPKGAVIAQIYGLIWNLWYVVAKAC
ncbi:MAG: hypothetical protein EBZ01_12810, partial [Betaproteobacteria bacterium]|nr:hypothetical protein [Betaproteobacteria bacterium]